MELMYELVLESPDGSAERDQWASLGTRQLNRLKDMFQQHVVVQLGGRDPRDNS